MTAEDPASRGFSLRRWSQRKLEAARPALASDAAPSAVEATGPAEATPAQPPATAPSTTAEEIAAPALPPIESLTIDSDFSVFLGSKADPAMKLQALKKLFRDPHFNVMDGLDVYIDDYSIPSPLKPEIARTLAHARYVFDPPRTRVNEAGSVEDVPPDEASIDARAPASDATTELDPTSPPEARPALTTTSPPGAEPSSRAESSPSIASSAGTDSSADAPSPGAPPSPAAANAPSAPAADSVIGERRPLERSRIEPTRR